MAHPASDADMEQAAHPEHHGSFWPLWLTLATTLFLIGLLHEMRNATGGYPIIAFLGFLGMVASVVGWVREDVEELTHAPFEEHHSSYFYGMIVLILSEIVLFGVLFTSYFWSRAHTSEFYPEGFLEITRLPGFWPIAFNTVVLVSSGGTVHMAQLALKRGAMRKFRIWLGITIVLGAIFVGGQIREYNELINVKGITPQGSVFGTSFFSLTGVHGLHVVAGLAALSTIFALSLTGFVRKERAHGVEGAFFYWHFVDAIWILVVSIVYLRLI